MSRKNIRKAFVFTEVPFYLAFLFLDITDRAPQTAAILKYISILICAAMAAFEAVSCIKLLDSKHKSENPLVALICPGLIFTAISDWFLLFCDDIFPGLVTFCIVQTIYLVVIMGADARNSILLFIVRLGIGIIGMMILSEAVPDQKLLIATVVFYGISFIGNIFHLLVETLSKRIPQKCIFAKPVLFLTGMILFFMCDVNVLLFNLRGYTGVDSPFLRLLENTASVLIWAFYLPGQVMIVLSARGLKNGTQKMEQKRWNREDET